MPYTHLVVLLPGQTLDPAQPGWKAGVPQAWEAGMPYLVQVLATDANGSMPYNPPQGQVRLSGTDPMAQGLGVRAFSGGIATFASVRSYFAGGTVRFTAEDGQGIQGQSAAVAVSAGSATGSSLLEIAWLEQAPKAVAALQANVDMGVLQFNNPNANGAYRLQRCSYLVEDEAGGLMGGAVQRLRLMGPNGQVSEADLSSGKADLWLSGPDSGLGAGMRTDLRLQADMGDQATEKRFRLRLDMGQGLQADNLGDTQAAVFCKPSGPADWGAFHTRWMQNRPLGLSQSLRWYPNPFRAGNEALTFDFAFPKECNLTLKVYTLQGRLVRTVAQDLRVPGGVRQSVTWDGRNGSGYLVNNGVYMAVTEACGEKTVAKVAVLK
jgi:hypothetical protein